MENIYNEKIHTKAKEIIRLSEIQDEYLRDCIRACICPKCGQHVDPERFQDMGSTKCDNCGFKSEIIRV